MTFYRLDMLLLLWLLPLLLGMFLYARSRRKKALTQFAAAERIPLLTASATGSRRFWKGTLLLGACACMVVALARPAWNLMPRPVERYGRDIVIVLDVSRSMTADDLKPTRLERAKMGIRDVLETLRGDRVALVAFAGDAVTLCPLTLDYGFFKMMLDSAGPDVVGRGGTMIGDAVRTVMAEVFDDQERQFKDIVLITDGEDHDSFPVEAAADAGRKGVRLFAIGLGDDQEGRRISRRDAKGGKHFLTYQGREVWSKLDADTLRKMASATPGGGYLHVATAAVDLGDVYKRVIAGAETRKLASDMAARYQEKFQIFLALALGLLLIDGFLQERRRERPIS